MKPCELFLNLLAFWICHSYNMGKKKGRGSDYVFDPSAVHLREKPDWRGDLPAAFS
jgi:hypothetical protein